MHFFTETTVESGTQTSKQSTEEKFVAKRMVGDVRKASQW